MRVVVFSIAIIIAPSKRNIDKVSIKQNGDDLMIKIEVYSKGYCPYCKQAKATLKSLGLAFEEYEITGNDKLTREMQARSKRRTVPQIFINDQHIGGGDDFHEALRSGALTHLLTQKTA